MSTTALPSSHPSAPSTCHGRWMSPEYEPGLVSVIVPTYNRAHLIVETLDSVFAQTYRPLELLIVDDGSTDNTADVVRQWEQDHQQDGFTVRFMSQENRGAPAARNLGLIESHGEFIQFLDSDDLIHPEKLEIQVVRICEDHADFVWSDYASFEWAPDWTRNRDSTRRPIVSACELLKKGGLTTYCGIYRRSTCSQLGPWHEDLRIFQDGEYNLRLVLQFSRLSFIPAIMTMTRVGHGTRISDHNVSLDVVHSLRRYEDILAQFDELHRENRETLARLYTSLAIRAIIKRYRDVARASIERGSNVCVSRRSSFRLYVLQWVSCTPISISAPLLEFVMCGRKAVISAEWYWKWHWTSTRTGGVTGCESPH